MISASLGVLGIEKSKDGSYVWKLTGKKVKFVKDSWKAELKKEQMRILNMKSKPEPKTYHEGANDERTAVLAHVRRKVGKQPKDTRVMIDGTELVSWLLGRNERYKKRNGGL